MSIQYSAVGATTVIVVGGEPPSDEAWKKLVDWFAQRAEVGDLRVLWVSHGAAPDAATRQALVDRGLRVTAGRVACVTESRLARGAAAAMSWFLDYPLECFTPDEAERALAHLEIDEADRARLREAVGAHEEELGLGRRLLEDFRSRRTPLQFRPES